MLNRDFTYCGGYLCRLASRCKRFNLHAFDHKRGPLYWMPAAYDAKTDTCDNFIKDDHHEIPNCSGPI